MFSALIIGLDSLSKKIIEVLKQKDCTIFGFDFDVDKINSFYGSFLIKNSSHTILNELLKKANVIILNIEYSRYMDVFKLVPFINEDCLILNTNMCKNNIENIKKMLQIRKDNFLPCNFLLFPKNVVINCDASTKMNTIRQTSEFFHYFNIETSILEPAQNEALCNIYQLSYLFEHILFKNKSLHFVVTENKISKYEFFLDDIILNKANLLESTKAFLSNIAEIKNGFNIENFLNNNNLYCLQRDVEKCEEIDDDIVVKVLFEKTFIKSFITKNMEYYLNFSFLNFDYQKYDMEAIKEYYENNMESLKVSLMIIKEKLISLSSFLQFDDTLINKKHIKEFLNN